MRKLFVAGVLIVLAAVSLVLYTDCAYSPPAGVPFQEEACPKPGESSEFWFAQALEQAPKSESRGWRTPAVQDHVGPQADVVVWVSYSVPGGPAGAGGSHGLLLRNRGGGCVQTGTVASTG